MQNIDLFEDRRFMQVNSFETAEALFQGEFNEFQFGKKQTLSRPPI